MFSRNGKLSQKQIRRMMVMSVFASIIFVLPYLSAKMFGKSLIPGLLIFFVFSGVYVLFLYGIGEWYEYKKKKSEVKGYISLFTESGIVGVTLSVIQLFRKIIRLAFYIMLSIAVLKEAEVPFMIKTNKEVWSDFLVVLPLLLVAVYAAGKRMEKQGRLYELLFWILFVPFLVMILFGLKEVDYQIFVPQADKSWKTLFFYAYLLLVFVLPMENYLYLRPYLGRHEEKPQRVLAVILAVMIAVLLTVLMLGIYGINSAGKDSMTTIAIMRYIRLPFGVMERFDVLMIWFFMTGCFVLISQTLFGAGHLYESVRKKSGSNGLIIGVLVLATGIAFAMRTYDNGLLTFLCYGAVVDIPLSIVLPLVALIENKR